MAYLIELNLTKTLRDNLIEPDRVDNWLLCQSFALQRGGWEEPSPGCWPVEGHRASTGPGADILTGNTHIFNIYYFKPKLDIDMNYETLTTIMKFKIFS